MLISRRYWHSVFLPAFIPLFLAAMGWSLPIPGFDLAASFFILLAAGLYLKLLQRYWEETGDLIAEIHRFRRLAFLPLAVIVLGAILQSLAKTQVPQSLLIWPTLPVFATVLFILLSLLLQLLRLSPNDWKKKGLLIFGLALMLLAVILDIASAIQFLVFFLLGSWILSFDECAYISRGEKIKLTLFSVLTLIFLAVSFNNNFVPDDSLPVPIKQPDGFRAFGDCLSPLFFNLVMALKRLLIALLVLLPLKILLRPVADWLRHSLRIRTKLLISYVFSSIIPVLLLAIILFFGFLFTMGSYYQRFVTQLISTRASALLERLDLRGGFTPTGPGNRLMTRMMEEDISAALFEIGHAVKPTSAYFVQTPFERFQIADSTLLRMGQERFNGLFLADSSLYLTQWASSGNWVIAVFREFTISDLRSLKAQCGLDLAVYTQGNVKISILGRKAVELGAGSGPTGIIMRTDSISEKQSAPIVASLPILVPGLLYDDNKQIQQSHVLFTIRISLNSLFGSLFSAEYPINKAYLLLFIALTLVLGAILVLVAMIGFGLAGGITKSISLLRQGTQQIGQGDLNARIHIRSRDELGLLAGSFNSMAADLVRMLENMKDKERMEGELEAARAIQLKLLPQAPPEIAGYLIAAASLPAKQVGGDYFDFLEGHAGGLTMVVGDVSGKGMPAALLMANLQASLRALCESGLTAQELTARLNRVLFANTDPQMFATFFFCALYPETGQLVYVNAGHNAPVLCGDGRLEQLSAGGLPLGVLNDSIYAHGQIELKPGELVALYSDGIVEAADAEEREFGEERFITLLQKHCSEEPETILRTVIREVQAFCGTPQDDVTLVILKRL